MQDMYISMYIYIFVFLNEMYLKFVLAIMNSIFRIIKTLLFNFQ